MARPIVGLEHIGDKAIRNILTDLKVVNDSRVTQAKSISTPTADVNSLRTAVNLILSILRGDNDK